MPENSIAKLALIAALLMSAVAALSFSAPLSATVLPVANFQLDANQSAVNFTVIGSGGIPFGPYNNTYIYLWGVQPGTYCPGYQGKYTHQLAYLIYIPNRTTPACVLTVRVSDDNGNITNAATGVVAVNSALHASGILTRPVYTIFQGQSSVISMNSPTGGTAPYHYQWQAAFISTKLNATLADSLCASTSNTLSCTFSTNASTIPGVYEFGLEYWDSATIPAYLYSNVITVRVGASKNTTSSVMPTTTESTSSVSVSSTVQQTTLPTTTIAQSVAATPLSGPEMVVSQAARTVEKWLKTLISYVV